jgi:hypothetical protein
VRTLITVQSDGRVSRVDEAPSDWGEFLRVLREREREREEQARERARSDVRETIALAFRALTWLSRLEV